MSLPARPIVHHIPACPFSQRLEIMLTLKGIRDAFAFQVVDITRPRDPDLLQKTRGTTALPVLETPDGRIIKESLVILRYIEDLFPDPQIVRTDPYERAVEAMLMMRENDLVGAGYRLVMNQDATRRQDLLDIFLSRYAGIEDFLNEHAPNQDFLFDRFGLAEATFAPIFARFWFLDYYENVTVPDNMPRLRRWHDACLAHPAAQQVSREEIIKLYYDYALGAGNGALLPGRRVSSFTFQPDWRERPMPPRDKTQPASDSALGLTLN